MNLDFTGQNRDRLNTKCEYWQQFKVHKYTSKNKKQSEWKWNTLNLFTCLLNWSWRWCLESYCYESSGVWPLEKVGFIRCSVGRSTADVEQRQWSTSSAVCVKRRRVVMRCSVRSLLPGGKAIAITDRHVNKKASHHRARRTKRCRMFDLTFNI